MSELKTCIKRVDYDLSGLLNILRVTRNGALPLN